MIASLTSPDDTWSGSSGSLLPLFKARLLDDSGHDIDAHNQAGELLLSSPSIMQGYLGDDDANAEAFESEGWLRTGDVGMFKISPNGTEHLFIVDRWKDMIKVKVCAINKSPMR